VDVFTKSAETQRYKTDGVLRQTLGCLVTGRPIGIHSHEAIGKGKTHILKLGPRQNARRLRPRVKALELRMEKRWVAGAASRQINTQEVRERETRPPTLMGVAEPVWHCRGQPFAQTDEEALDWCGAHGSRAQKNALGCYYISRNTHKYSRGLR
jgi:hypothetical protein